MTGTRALLAIESSCDETAAAVVTLDGHVLSNAVTSQIPIHARFGGVVPELASRNHLVALAPVVAEALAQAGRGLEAIDGIAVTSGPGLAGCLLVGLQYAKACAWSRGLPLIPVDHIHAHMHAPFLIDATWQPPAELVFPYIALAVSGGHTSIAEVAAPGQTVLLGQTLDDAAGEAFDKIAKLMGLPYPGGIYIDRLAKSGRADAYDLPRPLAGRGLDFSFSGLKTAARLLIERAAGGGPVSALSDATRADLAASVQEAIVDILVDKALAACRQRRIPRLVIAGGVACNERLREKLVNACSAAQVFPVITPARFCSDNAAMIGGLAAAYFAANRGVLRGADLLASDIHVTSRPPRASHASRP